MDPLAFRLKNYAEVEPISGKPFSSKALRECYAQGAERFGWAGRPLAPRQMRDEAGLLVGWGMGTATFPALMFQAQARAVIRRDGTGVDGDRRPRHGPGRLDRAGPDRRRQRSGSTSTRSSSAPARPTCRMRGIAGGSAHTATAGMAIHGAGADVDRQAGGPGHGRPALAAVRRRQCRRDRARRPAVPPRRREPQRELRRHPRPRRPRARSRDAAAARPTRRRSRTTPCTRTARCSPR